MRLDAENKYVLKWLVIQSESKARYLLWMDECQDCDVLERRE